MVERWLETLVSRTSLQRCTSGFAAHCSVAGGQYCGCSVDWGCIHPLLFSSWLCTWKGRTLAPIRLLVVQEPSYRVCAGAPAARERPPRGWRDFSCLERWWPPWKEASSVAMTHCLQGECATYTQQGLGSRKCGNSIPQSDL